jgi:hypothetical protein
MLKPHLNGAPLELQSNDNKPNGIVVMLSVIYECHCAECHDAECNCAERHSDEGHFAECHYSECHFLECRGAWERWQVR